MKIALVNTLGRYSKTKYIHHGIAYIIQYANLHGEKVDFIDLRKFSWKEFKDIIKCYDLVGYSVVSNDYQRAIKAISINRKANSDVTVVVGGIDPSIDSGKYVKNQNIDYVVAGEGEISFFKIIQAKKANKKLEKLILGERIENLDELGFINRDIFPEEEASDPYFSKRRFSIFVGRVCLYNCKYCQPVTRSMFGSRLRVRSPEHVVKELIYLRNKYGLYYFQILDDNILQNRKWLHEFIEYYKFNNFEAKFMIGGRSDNVIKFEDLIKELHEMGLRMVFMGYESGSNRMLKLFNKGTTVEQNEHAISILNKNKIQSIGSLMFGFPQETKYDMKLTEEFIKRNPDIFWEIFTFIPFPGTHLFNEYKKKDLLYNPENPDNSTYKPKIKGVNYYRVVWMIFKLNFKYKFRDKFNYRLTEFLTLIYRFLRIQYFYICEHFKKI
ncbi:MAG: B12-binding domain-containing radical SAM protein [Methanobrevibacter sp.]|jgi:radical SAM superfamily enzyme YgiQ (UPF0313 family)|nr:B12-binding domain-containing radical SAM protein [Candidatus Methanovirga aequatorialis]